MLPDIKESITVWSHASISLRVHEEFPMWHQMGNLRAGEVSGHRMTDAYCWNIRSSSELDELTSHSKLRSANQ
jgi:hypothetical protein